MNLKEGIKWQGTVTFGIVDIKNFDINNPRFKRKIKINNKITNYARQYIAQMLSSAVIPPFVLPSQMELGTGTGTVSASDTDLWAPSAGTLKLCSNIQNYLSFYAQYTCAWQTTDPIQGTWTEAGLKDINGNLWAHVAITSNLTVNSGEMLVGQWQVQILGN